MAWPYYEQLYQKLKEQGLLVIIIETVPLQFVEQALSEKPVKIPVLSDPDYAVSIKYGIYLPSDTPLTILDARPSSFLLDSTGKITGRWGGFAEPEIRETLRKMGFKVGSM